MVSDADGVEDIWLLNEITRVRLLTAMIWQSRSLPALDLDETYIRVPWNFQKRVKEFIALLDKQAA